MHGLRRFRGSTISRWGAHAGRAERWAVSVAEEFAGRGLARVDWERPAPVELEELVGTEARAPAGLEALAGPEAPVDTEAPVDSSAQADVEAPVGSSVPVDVKASVDWSPQVGTANLGSL